MKIAFIANLGEWLKNHKKSAALLFILLACALGAGGWFGWQEYQYRQTCQYALERLKKALAPPDTNELVRLVDFNTLTQELAGAISKNFPFYKAGSDQERSIRNILQTALLKKFLSKDKPAKAIPADLSEEELLGKNLEILPPDFVDQLLKTMTLRETDADTALLSAQVDNPLLMRNFTVVLGMDRTRDGWKVRHVANASELVGQLRDAMLERHARLRNVYMEKNAGTTKKMNQLLPIQSCTADAGLLSDGKTLLLVVHVIARNKGKYQVNNFNVDTSIYGKKGELVLRRYLNTAKPVAPGEDFNHRWNFELESDTPLARNILHSAPLQCRAAWQTLGVGNGEVLHIVEVPNPDRQCAKPGHDHPEGFCETPVFLQ